MNDRHVSWGAFANGTIHLVCSSHNDIAWFDTPAATITWRDEKSITPALARIASNPQVSFSMENVLYLLEYLDRHPERKDEIQALVIQKRLDWGATYNQPYESFLSGEQLIRQVYFGRKLLRHLFPGADARVYYSPDVPGRAMQMPQILAKAGIPYMLISRHKPGLQRWNSPDGSGVLAWSMGHYSDLQHCQTLEGDFADVVERVRSILQTWSAEYQERALPPHFAFLYSADYIPPKDFDQLIEAWAAYHAEQREQGKTPPTLTYSTPEQFFDAIAAAHPRLEVITGERPNVWLYIHGPGHHHAASAKRAAGIILPAAEIFSTIAAHLNGRIQNYPADTLRQAWANAIYDDHGWGGHNGHITDHVFLQRLTAARDAGHAVLNQALQTIAKRVIAPSAGGTRIVMFNSLSWARTDPVTCRVPNPYQAFAVFDAQGHQVPYQLRPDGDGISVEVQFVAQHVPSIGYTTYTVTPVAECSPQTLPEGVRVTDTTYENAFYQLELGAGGIRRLYDKQLGQELLCTEHYLGAEVFMIESVGQGAGEFSSVQQPNPTGTFERVSSYAPSWSLKTSGPVSSSFSFTQPMAHATLVQTITCFHALKSIDCDVAVLDWDGTKSRELRLAVPLQLDKATITYQVPMGVVEVGTSEIRGVATTEPVYPNGPNYADVCKDIHPREVQHFISASDARIGVTLSSPVAVFDYIDPRRPMLAGAALDNPVLQLLLLATRQDCHERGGWYTQAGNHYYHFSITSHVPAWRNGYRAALQAANPLLPVVTQSTAGTELPPAHSFLEISADNVLLSTLKKCEDDDSAIVRCYDIEGRDVTAEVRLAFPIRGAEQTNLIEEEGQTLPHDAHIIRVGLGHHAIQTFKVTLDT